MKKKYSALIITVVILLAIHLVLPIFLKNRINDKLAGLKDYHGSIEGLGLRLYSGELRIKHFKLIEEASLDTTKPFVKIPEVFFGVDWSALFNGKFVMELTLNGIEINAVKRKASVRNNADSERIELAEQLSQLSPLTLNYLIINNGMLSYIDPTSNPKVAVSLSDFDLLVTNISNVKTYEDSLPSLVNLKGKTYKDGNLELNARADFIQQIPDFNYQLKIEDVNISEFNEFFEAYANFGVSNGSFSFFSEASSKNGRINGYAKPVIDNLKIAESDSADDLINKVYNKAAKLGKNIIENSDKQRLATKFPIEGDLSSPKIHPWQAIWNIMRNGFIEAYKKKLEHTIQLNSES